MNRGLNLDTGNVEINRRYSFLQTPLEMHVPGLQPPANDDPALHQHHHPQQQPAAAIRHDHAQSSTNIENKEKAQAASPQHDPVASPYTLPVSPPPPPPEQHPANFAPYADEMIQHTTTPRPVQLQSPRQSDAPVPQYSYGPVPTSPGPLPVKADPSPSDQGPSARPVTVAPDTNPLHSPRIPPATATSASQAPALEDAAAYHQPGQVRHPDQEIKGGTWSHSMCDCSNISTCCLGIFCPCVLYGKTQYRLGLKSRKEDPTNLLGYDSCNGSCTAMALLCPCQCEKPIFQPPSVPLSIT